MKVVRPSSELLANTISPSLNPLECSVEMAVEATQASPAHPKLVMRERQCLEAATPPAILVNDEALSPDKLSPHHTFSPVKIENEEEEEEDVEEEMHSRYVHFTRLKQKGPALNGNVRACVCVSFRSIMCCINAFFSLLMS